jgi:hypothetical protein
MKKYFCIMLATLMIFGNFVFAQSTELIIYPSKNQSNEQMEKDKFQCYTWSKGQTGFDPMQRPTTTTAPPQQGAKEGGVVKGAAGGALVGTAAGAIAGNTGKGAAIGASTGALVGGMRRRNQRKKQKKAEQDWANREVANYEARRNEYDRAYSACLEGRGYTVR